MIKIILKEELNPNDINRGFQAGDTVTKAVKKEEPKPEQYTTEQIKKSIISACASTTNIKPEFALAVAFRESSLKAISGKGSYKGVFSIGPAAIIEMGFQEEYEQNPNSVSLNIYIGVRYLQYFYDRIVNSGIITRFKKAKFNDYVLTYIAYNLGYNTMLDIIRCLVKGTQPSGQTITFITAQSERFVAPKDPVQTVKNYYNEIVSVFGKI